GWVAELADAYRTRLGDGTVGLVFSAWASEIAADAFAHVHCGYGAAMALHDVLDGSDSSVYQLIPGDPHPVSTVRILMVLEMCRQTYGDGPWERTRATWMTKHPVERCPREVRGLVEECIRLLPRAVQLTLATTYRAFGNRPLTSVIDPRRVSPQSLEQLRRESGASAFTSGYYTFNEAIRLLALTSYDATEGGSKLMNALQQQESWMLRLGMQRAA
ncbi:MAG TPA: hypothetical protein VEB19_07455, partial [Gemmatimonadaceae bacterium]|nr:hypothetical protein [Gemmatimonadaceae bacterium]